jgi:hypothetical protein
MTSAQNPAAASSGAGRQSDTTIFGVPIGRLGLIASILMGAASGMIVFFVTFVLAIVGVAIYDSATGRSLQNLNISYLYIAAPIGVLALLVTMGYLLTKWARRKIFGVE